MNARMQAAKDGKATYTTGNPCRRGHVGERYTSTGHCVTCQREHSASYSREANSVPAITLKVYPREAQALGLYSLALAAAHWPTRDLTGLVKKTQGRHAATGAVVLRVPCHPSDEQALQIAASALRQLREQAAGRQVLSHVWQRSSAPSAGPAYHH